MGAGRRAGRSAVEPRRRQWRRRRRAARAGNRRQRTGATGELVVFSASQPDESTPELKLPPGDQGATHRGLFTFALSNALVASGPATYEQLAQQVMVRYAALNRVSPTPRFEGPLDKPVPLLGTRRALARLRRRRYADPCTHAFRACACAIPRWRPRRAAASDRMPTTAKCATASRSSSSRPRSAASCRSTSFPIRRTRTSCSSCTRAASRS